MESLCAPLLTNYLETTLCAEQYGFHKNRSTSLAIFNYTKFVYEEINKNKIFNQRTKIHFQIAMNT